MLTHTELLLIQSRLTVTVIGKPKRHTVLRYVAPNAQTRRAPAGIHLFFWLLVLVYGSVKILPEGEMHHTGALHGAEPDPQVMSSLLLHT